MADVFDICATGDVVLVLDDGGKPQVKLRVASQQLSLASPVFARMFSSKFSEGQNLSAAGPTEVPVPDDDPQLMKHVCEVIHFKPVQAAKSYHPGYLVGLAPLVDKYECHTALGTHFSLWSRLLGATLLDDATSPDYGDVLSLLEASWILGSAHDFEFITLQCIRGLDLEMLIRTHETGGYSIPKVALGMGQCPRMGCEASPPCFFTDEMIYKRTKVLHELDDQIGCIARINHGKTDASKKLLDSLRSSSVYPVRSKRNAVVDVLNEIKRLPGRLVPSTR